MGQHHVIHTAVVSTSVHINLYHFPDITNTNKIFFQIQGRREQYQLLLKVQQISKALHILTPHENDFANVLQVFLFIRQTMILKNINYSKTVLEISS